MNGIDVCLGQEVRQYPGKLMQISTHQGIGNAEPGKRGAGHFFDAVEHEDSVPHMAV